MTIKKATTFEEQIGILKSRGLIVEDFNDAKLFIQNINYYRFTAYLIKYKEKDNSYKPGIKFNDIKNIYFFDQELRHLVVSALEIVELSFRTYIAYTIAHLCGPLGYLESNNFIDSKEIEKEFLKDYEKEIKRKHDKIMNDIYTSIDDNKNKLFIRHHNKKYNGEIPIWMLVEVISFGTISRIYKLLTTDQQMFINKNLCSTSRILLKSWVGSLNKLRNECAHYGRLYGVTLPKIKIANKYKDNKVSIYDDTKLFAYILAIKDLIYSKDMWRSFVSSLHTLLDKHSGTINLYEIGFPEDWFEVLSK
ncbi:Abi family protein [Peptostreptococcus russellii]|uniref:Abi family protein n=1 Tax=Peptostreptococcus russellii TaxID=215200 RepID=UPI0029427182|nr:Abi family protein [Peptostreptococcus russellii]